MTPEGGSSSSSEELEELRRELLAVHNVANQLAERMLVVEARLAHLDGAAPISAEPHAAAVPPPLPPLPPQVQQFFAERPVEAPPPMPSGGPPPLPPPPPPPPSGEKIETQVGLTWVNRIGVITLIIGFAFFFKYAIDNDWVGPSGRVVLGVLMGALAIFAGDVMWKRNQRLFAQGISGLGISILYLSFYAAFGYYNLIPQSGAFLLMIVTTAAAGALALRYNARAIAILTLIGGYSTPLMLSTGTPNDIFYLSYMALLNGVVLYVARLRKWKLIEVLALTATMFLEGGFIANRHRQLTSLTVTISCLVQYGLFASGPMWPVAAIAQLAAASVIASKHWQPLVELLLVAAGLGVFYWRKWAPGPSVAFVGWWLAYAVAASDFIDPLAHHAFLYSSIAFLIFLAWPVWLSVGRREMPGLSALTTMALNGLVYFGVAHDLLKDKYADYMGLLAVLVAALYLASGWLIWNSQNRESRDARTPILAAGMALAFLALAVPIQFTGYRVAIAWSIQAAAVAWIASRFPAPRALFGTAILAFLALGDLPVGITYAPANYRPLLNTGFVTITVFAVTMWLVAYFITKTPGVQEAIAGVPYVVGHVAFLSALHYEIFSYLDWTQHSWDAKLFASTLLLAVYGLLLLMLGIRTRTLINRMMGLILFGVVIFKLYLSDVWILDKIFRMIAFLALGALLVAGSYLYSRYRSRIETLWKKDDATATVQ